jgi:anti-anti-sigma factor
MSETPEGPGFVGGDDDEPTDLLISRAVEGCGVVIRLCGDLDMTTLDHAEREIGAATQTGPTSLVIDLSGLDFMDSSGVRLVILAENTARGAGRRVTVRLGDGPARRVFQTLGLLNTFPVEPTGSGTDHHDGTGP